MSTGGVAFCTHKLRLITQALNPGWNPGWVGGGGGELSHSQGTVPSTCVL